VVVIIGVIYSLVIGKLERAKTSEAPLTLKNLRAFMLKHANHHTMELTCIERCSECTLFQDKKEVKRFTALFKSEPVVYDFDRYIGTKEHIFSPYFDKDGREFDVCFSYRIDQQGVGDSFLVQTQEGVIYYPSFFGETLSFVNIEEAVNFLQDRLAEVSQ